VHVELASQPDAHWSTVRGGRIVDRWALKDIDDRRRRLRGPTPPA
jgi:hypothetical protein